MEDLKYKDSNIDERIVRAVTELGFDVMTPIQAQAIPVLMEGKDVIGQAQTGTGKTAAFGIPMLQFINPKERYVQAIVLCPTRELAIQAASELRRFAKYMSSVKIVPVYGGQDISGQIKLIKSGAQIVVGTPGRVMDHMRRRTLKMDKVRLAVLDEADEMLNMGFREDMETILKELPEEHQTALFSATMPKAILDITHQYQKKDAVNVRVAAKELTIPLVTQYYYVIKGKYKAEAVKRLLQFNGITRSIVFCNTKKMVDDLTGELKQYGYTVEGLHGDLSQKQRDMVMKHFRNGNTKVLIATDVAARGIDVDDVEAVINYDIPQDIEYYVHRIGRTGRAGKEGVAFTLVTRSDFYRIKDIERMCRTKMNRGKMPGSREITELQAEKCLLWAMDCAKGEKLLHLKEIVELKRKEWEDAGFDIADMAAALLKLNIGAETTDLNIEDKIYEFYGNDRGNSGRGSRESYGGFGRGKSKAYAGHDKAVKYHRHEEKSGRRFNKGEAQKVSDWDSRRRDSYSHNGYSETAYKSTRKLGKK